MNGLLADACEACVLGQIGDVAMHLAIHLDVLYHFAAIGLESAVEVMQIVNAAHPACCGVEELCGDGLGQRVALTTVHLIAAHQVVTVLANHSVEFGNLVGRILQVGVHGDDHIAFGLGKAAIQSRALAIVAAELDATHHIGVFCAELLYHLP